MKLLFLDIDGVLNSTEFFRRKTRDKVSICRTLTARVNAICVEADAQVVISSTWRVLHPLPWLRQTLRRKGLRARVLGVTPDLSWCPGNVHAYRHTRGEEIARWLADNPYSVEGLCILDDDSDMAHLAPWHVKTSFETGITDADVSLAIATLGRPFVVGRNLPSPAADERA